METQVPSTDKGFASERIGRGPPEDAPDTLRDQDKDHQELSGGTEPLQAAPVVITEPLARPMAAPAAPAFDSPAYEPPISEPTSYRPATFNVYKADDTFRGNHPVVLDEPPDPRVHERIGLAVLGIGLALVVTFAVMGSWDDQKTSTTETTAATVTVPQPSVTASVAPVPPAPPAPAETAAESTPTTPSPPLTATPRRKPRAIPKRR